MQVLKVPQTSPLAWQTSLIDSEVDNILSGITNASKSVTTPKRKDFLRRGSGRTSATGSGTTHSGDGDGGSENEAGRQGETRRLELVPGEVCSLDLKAFVNIRRLQDPHLTRTLFTKLHFDNPAQTRIKIGYTNQDCAAYD